MPNLDCTSKEISIQSTIVPVRKTLVQWLTESRFGISKFGIPIEIRRYGTRLGDLENKQPTESLMSAGIGVYVFDPLFTENKNESTVTVSNPDVTAS